MACVTIDVLVLGEALGELPEFADVVCACHEFEDVDQIRRNEFQQPCLHTYMARVDAVLSYWLC